MNPNHAAQLLAIVAAYDNRKPDASTAQAWALALGDLRLEDCREVVVEHYRASTDWIMPAHVIAGVKRLREKRLTAHEIIDPPPGMDADDTDSYLRWLAETRRAIADGEIPTPPRELPRRTMPDLQALMPRPPRPTAKEKAAEDAIVRRQKVEAARAELEARPALAVAEPLTDEPTGPGEFRLTPEQVQKLADHGIPAVDMIRLNFSTAANPAPEETA